MDGGTLVQLCNLINQRNVVKDVTSNVTSCEEFFLLVVEAHILCAAMTVFHMSALDDIPSVFPESASALNSNERCCVLLEAIQQVVARFVHVSFGLGRIRHNWGKRPHQSVCKRGFVTKNYLT